MAVVDKPGVHNEFSPRLFVHQNGRHMRPAVQNKTAHGGLVDVMVGDQSIAFHHGQISGGVDRFVLAIHLILTKRSLKGPPDIPGSPGERPDYGFQHPDRNGDTFAFRGRI